MESPSDTLLPTALSHTSNGFSSKMAGRSMYSSWDGQRKVKKEANCNEMIIGQVDLEVSLTIDEFSIAK